MTDPYLILLISAAALGTFHTAIGIDHSLPLIALGRARRWPLRRALLVTLSCGLGHVLSSVAIAAIGLGLGVAGSRLVAVEESRGSWAACCLLGFGITYAALGLWKARRRELPASSSGEMRHLIPALVFIFTLGPCEALLPLLTASGITLSLFEALIVTVVFSGATIGTMMALVALGHWGTSLPSFRQRFASLERYSQVFAGLTLALSGASIQLFGI